MNYKKHESAIIDSGATIGDNTMIWHFTHICASAIIGHNCNLGQNVFIGNNVCIGNNVKIQNNVSIYDGVTLEDNVFCGPSMVFTNIINPRSQINRKNEYKPTLVKNSATIGANATIICGNIIGEYALIGAGCVVNSNISNNALIVGVPGKQIGWVCQCGNTLPKANQDKITTCKNCNSQYKFMHDTIIKLP